MMHRFFLFFLVLSCPAWLCSQSFAPDVIPSEAVGDALTKRMQGELEPGSEQLAHIREINREYAEEVSRTHRASSGAGEEVLRQLIRDWEATLREVFSLPQQRTFVRVRSEYVAELRLSGLQRSTARLALGLGLDAGQIARVETLETEYLPLMTGVREGSDPTRIKMRRLRGLQQEKEEKLKQILTAAQFEAYQEMTRKQTDDF
jgi:hypothetical protein